jgi:outer membrane lipoprotein-sorting protein
MKKIYFAIVLVLMFAVVHARQDEKAKDILDRVSQKTSSLQSIQSDFFFTVKNTELGINEKNEGNIILKGQKYCIDLPDVGIKIFSNEETIWSYMKNGNQVTITNVSDSSEELIDPSVLFNIYEKGFSPKFVKDTTVAGKAVHVLELFPDNNTMDVSKVSVNIDKSTMMLQSLLLYGTDGNQYGIEIKNMATNKTFTDSDFVFDAGKFPDVEIIDLR